LSPDGSETAKALNGLNVADNADHSDGRSLEDGDCLNDLLVVQFRALTLDLTKDVSHASLKADKGGQVRFLRRVVFGE
jgi:hypothetical protein